MHTFRQSHGGPRAASNKRRHPIPQYLGDQGGFQCIETRLPIACDSAFVASW
jgi:hypothetical protein